jgi:hypothetical protein
MICTLCKEDEKLSNSHIIPEFLYKSCYNKDHRFVSVSFESEVKERFEYIGVREKLLCAKCEGKFSEYETYVSKIFDGSIRLKSVQIEKDIFRLHGLDYKLFKLFGLSILWRSSVATHKMFSDVDLGPFHQEVFRQHLLNEDPCPQLKYGFFLEVLREPAFNPSSLIMKPTPFRLFDRNAYGLMFGGLIWIFIVSKQEMPEQFKPLFINEKGEMVIVVEDLRKVGFIAAAFDDLISKLKKNPKTV